MRLAADGQDWGMVEPGYRQLIVMRHAKTEQLADSDRARKLTPRGRTDARAGSAWLREQGVTPEIALVSPAARARETADLVADGISPSLAVRIVEELYGASPTEVIEIVAGVAAGARSVIVIGHNPTMADLVREVQRDVSKQSAAHLPTAGIAVLELSTEWADLRAGTAVLREWHVPRG